LKQNAERSMTSQLELLVVLSAASVRWIKRSTNKTRATASTRQLSKNLRIAVKAKSSEFKPKNEV